MARASSDWRRTQDRRPAWNAGLALVATSLVAFVDSDCVPTEGWLTPLLGHFDDPLVAAVAPRIVSAPARQSTLTSYERFRPTLDQGTRPGPVRQGSRISYVPSAALVVRADLAVGPELFDAALRGGEDVDLVWRITEAGWDVRYEPASVVAHDGPHDLMSFLSRAAFYGSTAGPLSQRHPGDVPPAEVSGWSLAVWGFALVGRPTLALTTLEASVAVLAERLTGLVRDPVAVAIRVAGRGTAQALLPARRRSPGRGRRRSSPPWPLAHAPGRRPGAAPPGPQRLGRAQRRTRPRPLRRTPCPRRHRVRLWCLGRLRARTDAGAARTTRRVAIEDVVLPHPASRARGPAHGGPTTSLTAASAPHRCGVATRPGVVLPVGRLPEAHRFGVRPHHDRMQPLRTQLRRGALRLPSAMRRRGPLVGAPPPRRAGRPSRLPAIHAATTEPTISPSDSATINACQVSRPRRTATASLESVEVGSADSCQRASTSGMSALSPLGWSRPIDAW